MAPAPKAQRAPKGAIVHDPDGPDITEEALLETQEDLIGHHEETQQDILNHVASRTSTPAVFGTSPKTTFMRRSSSTGDGRATTAVPVRGTTQDMREHLKHLGPSNLASRPKSTRYNAVKIKPGHSSTASDLNGQPSSITEQPYRDEPSTIEEMYTDEPAPQGGEGAGLLRSAGRDASDGVQALHQGYGSINRTPTRSVAPEVSNKASQANLDGKSAHSSRKTSPVRPSVRRGPSSASQHSSDTLGSLRSRSCSPPRKKGVTRSGSITENIVDTGGVRKVVLETNSSSDDVDLRTKNASGNDGRSSQSLISTQENDKPSSSMQNENGHGEEVKKKRKRRNKKKGAAKGEEAVVASSSGQQ
jgi:metal transporter CNNM